MTSLGLPPLQEDLPALQRGMVNLERHVENCSKHYGLRCVVSLNRFKTDTDAELEQLRARMEELGVPVVLSNSWAEGGKGAADLAHAVVDLCEQVLNAPHASRGGVGKGGGGTVQSAWRR